MNDGIKALINTKYRAITHIDEHDGFYWIASELAPVIGMVPEYMTQVFETAEKSDAYPFDYTYTGNLATMKLSQEDCRIMSHMAKNDGAERFFKYTNLEIEFFRTPDYKLAPLYEVPKQPILQNIQPIVPRQTSIQSAPQSIPQQPAQESQSDILTPQSAQTVEADPQPCAAAQNPHPAASQAAPQYYNNSQNTGIRNVLIALCVILTVAIVIMLSVILFFAGRYSAITETATSSQSQSQTPVATRVPKTTLPPQEILPETGTIFKEPTGYCVAPLTIDTTSCDENYYIYLQDVSGNTNNDMSFFVRMYDEYECRVPLGTYKVYCASGVPWYGTEFKFGKKTSYSYCDDTFVFTKDADGYATGYTLTLYPVQDGNLEAKDIKAEDFPG